MKYTMEELKVYEGKQVKLKWKDRGRETTVQGRLGLNAELAADGVVMIYRDSEPTPAEFIPVIPIGDIVELGLVD